MPDFAYTNAFGKPQQLNGPNANSGLSYEDVLNDDFQFDMDAHDVMVFLHIQKTGGTSFGKHLVLDLDLKVSENGSHLSRAGANESNFVCRVPLSARVNVRGSGNGVIASERIATRTGCSRATRPAGSAACMPIGRNWWAASTRSSTRTRGEWPSGGTSTSLCCVRRLCGIFPSFVTSSAAQRGKRHATGVSAVRRRLQSFRRAIQVFERRRKENIIPSN